MACDINSTSLWEGTLVCFSEKPLSGYPLYAIQSVLELYPKETVVNTQKVIVTVCKVGNKLECTIRDSRFVHCNATSAKNSACYIMDSQ